MGKLHKVRKAVEKNPAYFINRDGYVMGVSQITINGKVVSYVSSKSYRLYVAKILRKLGYSLAR